MSQMMSQTRSNPTLPVSERIYRRLLAVYPSDFRYEYGPEMLQVFRDRCREERRRGGVLGILWVWVNMLADLLVTALTEHEEVFEQDLRYGVRVLRKSPGFTLVAVLTLAFGIGANVAVFRLVNATLLRPLPLAADIDRVVFFWSSNLKQGWDKTSISPPDFNDWRSHNKSFEDLALFFTRSYNLTGGGEPERVSSLHASASLFPVLGVRPALGRTFLPEEDRAAADRVAILSYGLWQRRFGGDPGIVGQTVALDGQTFTVVGVMPSDYCSFFKEVELWIPLRVDVAKAERGFRSANAIGRLKPGVTLEQAQAEMDTITRQLEKEYPKSNLGWGAKLTPLADLVIHHNVHLGIDILTTAVGLVLLIACANVANLLLARAATRQKEIAIRLALGASRGRLVRQLLTESLLLGVLGGALGLLLAFWGVHALSPVRTDFILHEIRVDGRVLGFTLALSLLTAVIFGLVPALLTSKPDLNESLKDGGGASGSLRRHRFRNLLVVSELALALLLLISTGLSIKGFLNVQRIDPGFNPTNVLTVRIDLPAAQYAEARQWAAFYQQVLERLKRVPGAQAVGAVDNLPITDGSPTNYFSIQGRPAPTSGEQPWSAFRVISPDYFRAMEIPLRTGRQFTEQDTEQSPGVVIINEVIARRFWPNEDPIGKRIRWHTSPVNSNGPPPWRQVVGVVGSVRHNGVVKEPMPEIYLPQAQNAVANMVLVVRTASDLRAVVGPIRREVWSVDKNLPVHSIKTMAQILADDLMGYNLYIGLMSTFAAIALLLAAVGVYGVISYSVGQRTHEFGIRLALGAQARSIIKLVIGQGLKLVLVGLAIGLMGAFALMRVISEVFFGVSATDPVIFVSVSLLLTGVALLACYLPARKATKVDPMVALRYE